MDAIIDYRGKTPTKTDSGIPLITAKIIKDGAIQPITEFIAEDSYDTWMRRGLPEAGDVVLTTEAPLGEVAQLDGRKVALAQRVITLRGKKGILDNTYLKYLMQSQYVQHQLDGRGTGTTVKGIKQSELRQIKLKFPSFDQQKGIANILGTLDNKIELNCQINTTLEAMAQALFKSWFVDFDPVIDNALVAGNPIPDEVAARAERRAQATQQPSSEQPHTLPANIRQQFPDRFVLTEEMGWVPEGWKVSTIGAEVETTGGGTPSTKDDSFWKDGTHPFCTPKDMSRLTSWVLMDTERYLTDAGVKKVSSGQLPIETVLMSSRAPIGYLAISDIPVSVNQGIIAMLPNPAFGPLYLLNWAKFNMPAIIDRANGSTFLEISKKNFQPIPFIVPHKTILQSFNAEARTIHAKILKLSEQIDSLTILRDALLPKLLSGQLRIPEAEQLLAEAL
ncbi:restriction endonuclease subunit S [Halopseudomonas bauzanensis]|nr:restriction endonuclease subunit S [Halopseudomonas bauzanensis]